MWKKLCSAIIAIVKLLFDILVEVFNGGTLYNSTVDGILLARGGEGA